MSRTEFALGVAGTFLSALAMTLFMWGLIHIYREDQASRRKR